MKQQLCWKWFTKYFKLHMWVLLFTYNIFVHIPNWKSRGCSTHGLKHGHDCEWVRVHTVTCEKGENELNKWTGYFKLNYKIGQLFLNKFQ